MSGLVAVVLILGQASAVLHFDLIPHRFCPLHGLEDVRALHVPGQHEDAAPARSSKHPAAGDKKPAEFAHERCVLTLLVHERLVFLRARSSDRLPAPGAAGPVALARDAALLPNETRVDFAPKIGPPA